MGSSYCGCVNNYKKNCGLSGLISDIKINEITNNEENDKKEKFIIGLEDKNIFLKKKKTKTKKNNISTANTTISSVEVTKLTKFIRGFLIRNKYKNYLKKELETFTNQIYSDYINKISLNENVSKILFNPENNSDITKYLLTNWDEFYKEDPIKDLKSTIKKIKTYKKGLIFNYQNRKFSSEDINEILQNVKSVYKGEINIYTKEKNGIGEEIFKDGSQKFGTWYQNKFYGWNRLIDSNGNLYIGLFINDKLNGKGIKYTFPDHIYKGDFLNDLREGNGIDKYKGIIYEGTFKNDKKIGKAKIFFPSGDYYEGDFENNKFNGNGHYIWKKNGNEYIGEYLNGLFHGKGIYKWNNNEYYKGNYVNGIKEGNGEIFYPDGRKISAPFVNGKPHGNGTFDNGKGSVKNVEFINGVVNKKVFGRKK